MCLVYSYSIHSHEHVSIKKKPGEVKGDPTPGWMPDEQEGVLSGGWLHRSLCLFQQGELAEGNQFTV